jgi:hypothetical protein
MCVDPDQARPQNAGHDIALIVLRSHGGDDHVHPLFGGKSGHFGNAPVVFHPGFRGETQVGAKARANVISIQKKHRNATVNESIAQFSRKSRFARTTTPEKPKYLGDFHKGEWNGCSALSSNAPSFCEKCLQGTASAVRGEGDNFCRIAVGSVRLYPQKFQLSVAALFQNNFS